VGSPDAAFIDEVRIRQVLEHYCAALDHGGHAELADLFDANCSFAMMGRTYHGRAEILTAWEQLTSTDRPTTLHMLVNPVITVDGDRATAVSGWAMIDRSGTDGRTAIALAGHYRDTLERGADASWRFTSRRVQTLARAPRPQ
jgi:uncharacterized protein (TIGR02246 family)